MNNSRQRHNVCRTTNGARVLNAQNQILNFLLSSETSMCLYLPLSITSKYFTSAPSFSITLITIALSFVCGNAQNKTLNFPLSGERTFVCLHLLLSITNRYFTSAPSSSITLITIALSTRHVRNSTMRMRFRDSPDLSCAWELPGLSSGAFLRLPSMVSDFHLDH